MYEFPGKSYELAIGNFLLGCLLCITIIGIPFGKQFFKLAVVLGCTELPLILNDSNCPVACLDSVEIHIKELIDQTAGPRTL